MSEMKSFLVYRHGSNAANQSMTPVSAVAIVDATNEVDAKRIASENVNCYNNQHLELVAADDLTGDQLDDWNDVVNTDAVLRSIGEPGVIY